HQPEDEAVEGLLLWEAKLLDHDGITSIFTNQGPRGLAQLFHGQLQVRDMVWLDANQLTAGQVNGQAITSGHQYLQVGFIAIERSLPILTDAAIDDGQ